LPDNATVLDWALAYRRTLLSLVPYKPRTKEPLVKWKPFRETPPTEEQIHEWFGDNGDFGIAILMGDASGGLIARDFDDMLSDGRWARAYPKLAVCVLFA
jgi:hypothetical protein